MSEFEKLLESVALGSHPTQVVENIGMDRQDDIQDDNSKVAAFQQIAGSIQQYNGYVGPDWITQIADRIRMGSEGVQELVQMAQKNRDQYAGTARVDCDGCWDMWDNVLKGLLAVRTEQLPPV